MSKRKLTALCALALAGALTGQAWAVGTSAASAVLIEQESGRVLYEQNPDEERLIASITKIMTAVVALERGEPQMEYTVTAADMAEGSSMYLKPGDVLRLEELLYGLMLVSGNDAALAVAHCVCGGLEDFVALMNEMAGELGMEHSSFANPNGLDHEDHYSTARDMARLACAAVQNETLVRIASTQTVTAGGRTMTNHNKLLRYVDGCIGLKTGYTRAAGRTLVSCAERNGQRLVAVTLQDGNDWADHQALFEYGFSAYPARRAAVLGHSVGTAEVQGGVSGTVPLTAASGFSWPVGAGERLETRVELDRPLAAPVLAGTAVGQAVFTLDGAEVGRVDLLCGRTVPPELKTAMGALKTGLSE